MASHLRPPQQSGSNTLSIRTLRERSVSWMQEKREQGKKL
jgi:hypothetical protein